MVGLFHALVAILLSPTCFCVFFKDGPLAWNGLFAFYVPLTAYGIWMVVTFVLLRRAIEHQEQEATA